MEKFPRNFSLSSRSSRGTEAIKISLTFFVFLMGMLFFLVCFSDSSFSSSFFEYQISRRSIKASKGRKFASEINELST
jgi:hypothetical protein